MDNLISQHNQATVNYFFQVVKTSPEAQAQVKAGTLCLGVQGERLVVVNYGETRLSALIQAIKNFFTGVKVGEKAEIAVKGVFTHRAMMHLAAQKEREASKIGQVTTKINEVTNVIGNKYAAAWKFLGY